MLKQGDELKVYSSYLNSLRSRQLWFGFLGGLNGKESACNAGDLGLIPGSGRSPGEGSGKSTLVLLPGEFKFHGLRSRTGSSPWGHKET